MDEGFTMVLGMSISYIASFLGMFIAMWRYFKNKKSEKTDE